MKIKEITILIPILSFIFISGCSLSNSSLTKTNSTEQHLNQAFAITNVNVISMEQDSETLKNATVIIQNKKISSINGVIPKNAKVIDGKNKWLMPGLVDMHVHTYTDVNFGENKPTQGATFYLDTQDVMTSYIANAITTTFDLDAKVEHFAQRNEIAKGKIIGPRMALAALIDGGKGNGRVANSPNDGRQAVRSAKAEGYNFIKVYSFLNIETFKAIVDEANKQGLKVVGHIPDAFRGNIEGAFIPHFDLVAHAEEYAKNSKAKTEEDAQYFAQLAKKNNTWLTSSMITMVWIGKQLRSLESLHSSKNLKYVHPLLRDRWLTPSTNSYYKRTSPEFAALIDTFVDFQKKLIKAFNDAGVPIVAGTDSGITGVLAGFLLHDELELMVEAGMSTKEVLASATRLPTEWLGINKKVGTITVGKYADLALLDANPLEDIKNTRAINGVFVNGNWVNKEKIKAMLLQLEKKYKEGKNEYEWSKRKSYSR